MRKLSVWGMLCMVCTACFCAPSLRASSIPLNHQPSFIAPQTSVSAIVQMARITNHLVIPACDDVNLSIYPEELTCR